MSKHQSGVLERILSITLVNPSLLDRLDPGGPAGNWVFRFRARDLPAVAPAGAGGSK